MIETLTLPETMGTHAGFIAQATLRSLMAIGVPVAVAFGSLVTVGSEVTRARVMEAKGRLFGYWMLSLLITGAFLPESLVLGSLSQSSSGGDIVSAVASQHGGAIQTAQQLASSRGLSARTAAVPPLVYQLVQGVSGKWLIAGQMVHQAATKPGTTIYPMALFSGYRLPNDVVVRIQAWTDKCILPAQAKLSALSEAYDFEALRPIPGSALWSVMSSMRAPLGQGVLNLVIPLVGCTTEGGNIHSRALSAINSQTTPAGTAYGALWSEHLGISEMDAAHYFVEREVEAATGSNLPPSGLITKYAGLQLLRSTVGAGTTLVRTLNPLRALQDLGARLGEGTVGQLLDRLASVVGIALFFSTYFPLFLAVGQSVVLSMLPVAVLWSLASPGRQIRPLGIWFASLVVVYSGPMIYGLIELMSTIYAGNNISFSTSTVPQWAGAHIGLLLIQASGPVIFLLIASMVTLSGYGISRLSGSI